MHGKTLTWALALALTFAATAGAQGVDRQERSARPDRAQQDSTFRRGRGGPEGMLLRGITLSADQQQKLAQLRENARKEFAANRPRRDGGNGPDAGPRPRRERGDTAAMAARRAEMWQRFDERIAAVRDILTADQRTQFDKNVAEMRAHVGARDGGRGGWNGNGR
jgi:Spy/CpxP family protein refolding chaperone